MTESLPPQIMSVHDLFANSLFQVPDYQRAYAWEQKQCDDLWEDIREGMRTNTTHLLGTVVLMAQEEPKRDAEDRPLRIYNIVDGQQRITTLCLLLLAVFKRARETNEGASRGIWRDFIEHEDDLRKLQLGGLNKEYFDSLVSAIQGNESLPKAERLTDIRLQQAVSMLGDKIDAWMRAEGPGTNIVSLASYLRESLQVLRFVTNSQSFAIKTFQTVNDRGKELSLLDKSKSFLMFYLTRYLQEDIDAFQTVESTFSSAFDNYDAIRDLATKYDVKYLTLPQFRFNEDEFLRYAYHYGCNDLRSRFSLLSGYEYSITPDRIFANFVKDGCRQLRGQPDQLRAFILAWCEDLLSVSAALVRLLKQVDESENHRRLFQFQGPSGSVYPLLVAAESKKILDEKMLQVISILDLRVYKVRGTDPKAELYRDAVSVIKTGNRINILNKILEYCRSFGSDQEIINNLRGHVYGQVFTKYVLWAFAVEHDKEIASLDYEFFSECQVDHILPDTASTFDATSFGFSIEDYDRTKNSFGNLTPLEERLNKRAQNFPPTDKASIYAESRLLGNRSLGAGIIEKNGFRHDDQGRRTNEIVQFFETKWAIPDDEKTMG